MSFTDEDPKLYPVLGKDGTFYWASNGWRWVPSWLQHPLVRTWNRVNCWRIGHYWLPFDPDDDGRVPCAMCCTRRDPRSGD